MSYLNQSILLEHLRQGREEAFIYLVDMYNERLYAYALTLSRDEAMAQDITQNVFLRTWEKRRKISIASSLQNYLFKSVKNEFLNQDKHKRSTMILQHKYFVSLEKVTANYDEISFKKAMEKITLEIQKLPPKCKEVFLLSRKEGLTNIEISEYLKVSTKTVEAHITKAFSILREKLGDKLESILFMLFGIQGIRKNELGKKGEQNKVLGCKPQVLPGTNTTERGTS